MRKRLLFVASVLLGFVLLTSAPTVGRGEGLGRGSAVPEPTAHHVYLPLVQEPPPICYGRWDATAVTDGYPDKVQTFTFWTEAGSSRIGAEAAPKTYYRCRSGIFICHGTVTWHIKPTIPIDDNGDFHFNDRFNFLSELTWRGHFDTPASASGTFDSSVWTSYCGVCKNHGTWTAHYVGTAFTRPSQSDRSVEKGAVDICVVSSLGTIIAREVSLFPQAQAPRLPLASLPRRQQPRYCFPQCS